MTLELTNTILDAAAVILTVLVIARLLPRIGIGKRTMPATLFLFAMVSVLFSYIYWLTYTLMRPNTRLPFAANEIGEIAVFLLLSATLEAVFREYKKPAKKEILFTALFAAGSVALWIAWTGEWFQDIVGGFAFGYFLCICARCLKQTDVFRAVEWLGLGALLAALIIGQIISLFLSGAAKSAVDLGCYGVMFVVLVYILIKTIRHTARGGDIMGNLALSCTAYAISLSTMYMSEGWFYAAAMLGSLVSLPLMGIAIRREAEA